MFLLCACAWLLSHIQLFVTLWTVAHQATVVVSVCGIFQVRTLEWVATCLLQGIFLTQGLNSCLQQ